MVNPGEGGAGTLVIRTGRTSAAARGPAPAFTLVTADVRATAAGGNCRFNTVQGSPTQFSQGQQLASGLRNRIVDAGGIAACPTPAAAGPVVTPGQVAEPFVRAVPMPVPQLEIDPGLGITGLPAYLETGGTTTHQVGPAETELGPITVTATGAYYVTWGDGTPEQGPFAFEGVAFPEGRITHTYRDRGSFTVTVRETWTADWALAGDAGTVAGLQTDATLVLEVEEIQAVRDR